MPLRLATTAALGAAAILGGGGLAALAIHLETRPRAGPGGEPAPLAARQAPRPGTEAAPAPVARPMVVPAMPEPVWPPPNATAPVPAPPGTAPGAPPVVAAAPERIPALPADPEARADAVVEARRERFATGMEFLNRRNAARAGLPTPGAPPPPPPGGVASSRRGGVVGAPAVQPERPPDPRAAGREKPPLRPNR